MSPPRYANIDGLRAIAALCVMFEHMAFDSLRHGPTGSGGFHAALAAAAQSVSLGRFGVMLFFLISGFVVPFTLRGERPLTHFAVSRLFRLYPALWLAIALLAIMAWLNGDPPSARTVLANLSMAPALFGQPWLSQIYWTLFIELLFYAGIALLFAAGSTRRIGVLWAVATGLVAATLLPVLMRTHGSLTLPVQYVGLHLSFLFLGLLFRLAMVERIAGAWAAIVALLVAQGGTVVAVADFSLARGDGFIIDGLAPVLSAYVLAVVVFWAAIGLDRPRSVVLGHLGRISYSLYLFHGIVNGTVYRVVPLTGQIGDVAVMLLCVALTLAVATAVYVLVERPMIRLGRRLAPRGGRRVGVPAAPETGRPRGFS